MNQLTITVPLLPPSVNHYKLRTRRGVTFVSSEAKNFKQAIAFFARGKSIAPESKKARQKTTYALTAVITLGYKRRGDGDNFWKVIADGLVEAGVIHSDAAVKEWHLYLERAEESSTVITVGIRNMEEGK